MYSELELKAFVIADEWLDGLSKGKSIWVNSYGKGTEGEIAVNYLKDYKLISFRNPGSKQSLADITPAGLQAVKAGGLQKYLDAINKVSEEKTQLQDELTKKELQKINLEIEDLVGKVSDYQDNKWKSDWSFKISVATAIIALAALIVSLVK